MMRRWAGSETKRDLRIIGGGIDGMGILSKGALGVKRLLVVVEQICWGFH